MRSISQSLGQVVGWARSWAVRFLNLFRRRQLDARLDEELSFHLEVAAREGEARGEAPAAARRAARIALGQGETSWSVEALKREYRAQGGVPVLETLAQDLRYALRMLRKSPLFTAVALLSLAFGTGTNCAIFSVVDALLLKPLPVAGADRLVLLRKSDGGEPKPYFSYPAFRLLQQQSSQVSSGLAAVTPDFTAVVRTAAPEPPAGTPAAAGPAAAGPSAAGPAAAGPVAAGPVPAGLAAPGPAAAAPVVAASAVPAATAETVETATAELVSGGFFAVLGAGMAAGRPFTPAEDATPGGHPVAVISYGYWQRRFGRDPAVVGRKLLVNGSPVTVLGVTARGFRGAMADAAPEIFLPITLRELLRYQGSIDSDGPDLPGRPIWEQVNVHWLVLLARLAPGVTAERASAALNVAYQRDKEARAPTRTDPQDRRQLMAERLLVDSMARGIARTRGLLTRPLLTLLAVSGLVLVIACFNLANLLLARADQRRKEMAVRLGIGAGRARLLRQLLTESLLLAGLGGTLGLVCARWGSRLLLALVSRTSQPIPLDVDLDWRKLAFAGGVALATGIGFGLAPALRATGLDLAASLRQGTGTLGVERAAAGSGHAGRQRVGRSLVASQIALALLLLVGAGLFVRSLQNLLTVDPGFRREGLVLAAVNPHLLRYDDQRLAALYPRLVEHLEAIPGVRSASLASSRLLNGSSWDGTIALPGYAPRPDEDMDVQQRVVTPRYFETVGTPLVAGRAFTPRDRAGAPRVAVVDEAMARRFWPHGTAVGQRFGFGQPAHGRDLEIVGVVRNTRSIHLNDPPPPTAYLPVAQSPQALHDVEVRLAGAPAGAVGAPPERIGAELRRAIAEVEPDLPVLSVTTMTAQLERSLARERATARLIGFFGLLAALLAAIGLYGTMSYSVARRTSEIGLRMALGAGRGEVVGMVMREAARLLAAGVVAGLVAALAVTRLLSAQLFGLRADDPGTLAMATLAMIAVALAAGFLPARRAADTDPMTALRHE
jgi:predicted permease